MRDDSAWPAVARRLSIVGRRKGNEIRLALFCPAGPDGGHWHSLDDSEAHEAGARTIHSLCPECLFAGTNPFGNPQPPRAA